jgi:predicted transport protein
MPDAPIMAAMDGVVDNMQERTGRSLEAWVALVEREGPDPLDQKAVRAWLRDIHGVLQNSQWAIAMAAAEAAGWRLPTAGEYTESLYSGPKAHLRPIHDRALAALLDLGDDVEIEGRQSYITVRRARQFGLLVPATKSRVDLGLRFRSEPDHPRLAKAKNLGQCTHKVGLESVEEIDDDLIALMRQAFEENG